MRAGYVAANSISLLNYKANRGRTRSKCQHTWCHRGPAGAPCRVMNAPIQLTGGDSCPGRRMQARGRRPTRLVGGRRPTGAVNHSNELLAHALPKRLEALRAARVPLRRHLKRRAQGPSELKRDCRRPRAWRRRLESPRVKPLQTRAPARPAGAWGAAKRGGPKYRCERATLKGAHAKTSRGLEARTARAGCLRAGARGPGSGEQRGSVFRRRRAR